jgi:hypothetical protein
MQSRVGWRKSSIFQLFGWCSRGDRGGLDVAVNGRQSRGIFCFRRVGSTTGGHFSDPQNQPRSIYALEFGNSRQWWRQFLCRSACCTFGFVAIAPNSQRLADRANSRRYRDSHTRYRSNFFSSLIETLRSPVNCLILIYYPQRSPLLLPLTASKILYLQAEQITFSSG